MLLFSLLALLFASHRIWRAGVALRAKETAAAVPGIITARRGLSPPDGASCRRTFYSQGGLHPTLSQRLLGAYPQSVEAETRPTLLVTALKTLLVQINLEGRLAPESGWVVVRGGGLIGVLLGLLLLMAVRSEARAPSSRPVRVSDRRLLLFGAVWALLGWSVLFMPSISWHAYYGVLGTLGCWLIVGTILRRHAPLAAALVLCIAVLREARIASGTGGHSRNVRQLPRQFVTNSVPHPASHSRRSSHACRTISGSLPVTVVRVWYDATLEARYYSSYATRGRYARSRSVLSVRQPDHSCRSPPGTCESPRSIGSHAGWQRDHEVLASLLIHGGLDWRLRSTRSAVPHRGTMPSTPQPPTRRPGRGRPHRSMCLRRFVQESGVLLVEAARASRISALRSGVGATRRHGTSP